MKKERKNFEWFDFTIYSVSIAFSQLAVIFVLYAVIPFINHIGIALFAVTLSPNVIVTNIFFFVFAVLTEISVIKHLEYEISDDIKWYHLIAGEAFLWVLLLGAIRIHHVHFNGVFTVNWIIPHLTTPLEAAFFVAGIVAVQCLIRACISFSEKREERNK